MFPIKPIRTSGVVQSNNEANKHERDKQKQALVA